MTRPILAALIMAVVATTACRRGATSNPATLEASVPVAPEAPVLASAPPMPAAPVVSSSAAPSPARPASALYAIDKFDFLGPESGFDFWEKNGAAWIDDRVAAATKKAPELVRVPLLHRGEWGCMCPEYYFGVMSTGNAANRWIEPIFAPTAPEPEREVRPRRDLPGTVEVPGLLMIAEGYFTGETVEKRFGPDKPDKLLRFRVLRMRPPRNEADAKPVVVRPTLPELALTAPADKPFFVIHESFPVDDKDSKTKADRLVTLLRGKGFADAEALDSTTVPGLFCCYLAVTLGRYATEAEAARVATAAQKAHVVAAVRRGW